MADRPGAAVAALTFNAFVWGVSWWPLRELQSHGLHPLVSTAIVLRVAGVPGRLKHRLEGGERARDWQFFFTGLVESRTGAHKVVDNLALLAAAGIDGPEPDADTLAGLMQLQLTEAERGAAAAGWPRQPGRPVRIGMHPGCKPGWEFKRWDPARFADLADRLAGTHGAEILWFGGAEETGLVQGIMARMQHVEASRHVALGIRAAAAVMAGCDAFVSNDSGPMHVATSCGIPVVALFNDANPRTKPARTGPFGARHVVVGSSDIQAIEPARVAAAVARVLGRA